LGPTGITDKENEEKIIYSKPSTLLKRGVDYADENKCKKLFAESGKFNYTLSAKHTVVAYEKYRCCLKS
jgi:hypothetical protein